MDKSQTDAFVSCLYSSCSFFVLCSLFFVLCYLFFVLCSLFFVLCSLFFVLCFDLFIFRFSFLFQYFLNILVSLQILIFQCFAFIF